MATIYLVEDEANIRELVVYTLSASGYEALGFADASAFYTQMEKQTPHLVLLDIMLPGEDGLSILRKLRQNPATALLPVMMLTAKNSEYDTVVGLDAGADDYLAKPFGMMEMVSRVKALLRRGAPPEKKQSELTCGCITLLREKHTVTVHGTPVTLTLKEYELLKLLLENPGVVFTRDNLLERIWDYNYEGETRTVDVHVRSLRQKLGEEAGTAIETVRGVGYRLCEVKQI